MIDEAFAFYISICLLISVYFYQHISTFSNIIFLNKYLWLNWLKYGFLSLFYTCSSVIGLVTEYCEHERETLSAVEIVELTIFHWVKDHEWVKSHSHVCENVWLFFLLYLNVWVKSPLPQFDPLTQFYYPCINMVKYGSNQKCVCALQTNLSNTKVSVSGNSKQIPMSLQK